MRKLAAASPRHHVVCSAMVLNVIAWLIAGAAMSALTRAVGEEGQRLGLASTWGLGIFGGLGGGFLIWWLAQRTVAGFTAGFMGSLVGASVLLAAGGVLAEVRRPTA